MTLDLTRISKTLAHALRHEPWLYELELDDEGWTSVEDVLYALAAERAEWRDLREEDLARTIAESSKRRYEIAAGRIRALYGHSIEGKLKKTRGTPPEILYHGTGPGALESIRASGLLPMRRQYVHLSTDEAMAKEVGRRKAGRPIILKIAASEAHAAGCAFYEGNERVWLADEVPPRFISGQE